MAALRGIAKAVFAADDAALAEGRPSVLDRAFLAQHTSGLEFYRADQAEKLRGSFLLLPDPASLKALLRAVRVA